MADQTTGYTEDPYNPKAPYEGTADAGSEPGEPKRETPTVERRAGWNAYRGTEAHGVQIAEHPADVDSWEKDSVDELEAREYKHPKLRDAEPTPIVKGWSKEQAVRISGRSNAITLTRGSWTKVLDRNARRQLVSLWLTKTPQTVDVIYFFIGDFPDRPTAHCPRISATSQSALPTQFLFTEELWMFAETSAEDYVVSIFEESEVEA